MDIMKAVESVQIGIASQSRAYFQYLGHLGHSTKTKHACEVSRQDFAQEIFTTF